MIRYYFLLINFFMKSKLKKFAPIIFTVAIVIIIIGLIFLFAKGDKNKEEKKKKIDYQKYASEYVDKLTTAIIYGKDRDVLIKTLQTKNIMDTDIMTGNDMYLKQTPGDEMVKKYKLDSYVKAGKKYGDNLEKAIQNNFSYKIEGVAENEDDVSPLVSYQSYYYQAYIKDLSQIIVELLDKAGYNMDGSNVSATEKFKVDYYKAKIKAAEILDSHLNDYVNNDVTNKVYVTFTHKKAEASADSFMSYLMNLSGYTYQNQGYLSNSDDVNNMLNNASVDFTKPLVLK